MPAERTPAPAGHRSVVACPRSVSNVNSAIGTDGSSSVFQSTRHHVSVSVSPMATRKMSAPLRAAGPAGRCTCRAAAPARRSGCDGHAGRPVVVVEEVGPEQGAAGEAAGAAGARELFTERPSGRCRKLGLGPQRRGRHPFGHPVDHHELGRRGRRRRCDRLQNRVGDV